eukprot:scaffold279_cov369-Prasinococcus_capsulatus_cf.AAC.7
MGNSVDLCQRLCDAQEWGAHLSSFEELRVVAHLAQLNDHVHQVNEALVVRSVAVRRGRVVRGGKQVRDVKFVLHGAGARNGVLRLLGHLRLDVALDAPQHEGLDDLVQSAQLVLVERVTTVSVTLDALAEPLVEMLVRVEERGHDEVQQRPQLGHRILDGRARQQKPVAALEAEQCFPPQRGGALNRLRLIEDHVLPLDALEHLLVRHKELVARHEHVEGGVLRVQQLQPRREFLHLVRPIGQRGGGSHHQEGSPHTLLGEVHEEGERLHRFPEAHLIGEDAV